MIAKCYLHHVYNRQIKFDYKMFISYVYVLTNKERFGIYLHSQRIKIWPRNVCFIHLRIKPTNKKLVEKYILRLGHYLIKMSSVV